MESELTFEEKQKQYSEDSRTPCKYQTNCYQKNPDHHSKFKHPPKEEATNGSTKRKNEETEEADEATPESPQQKCPKMDGKTEEPEDRVITLTGLKMPNCFFKLYEFCKNLKSNDPLNALASTGLTLVGPYDILDEKNSNEDLEACDFKTHWRFFYDPPEFQTVIKGPDTQGLHFGYWRDSSQDLPIAVVSNKAKKDHKIQGESENIFGALEKYLEQRIKAANPFEKTAISNSLSKLKAFAKKENIELCKGEAALKAREKKTVAKTFHGFGIVVPYEKKTQLGYRELSVTDNELQKILKNLESAETDEEKKTHKSKLGEVIRLATIAGDECDFGTCLELGHDLFCSGLVQVHEAVLGMLSTAYNELDRKEFLKTAEAHLKNRKKEFDEALSNLKSK